MAKVKNKNKNKKSKIIILALLIFGVYAFVSLYNSYSGIIKKQAEIAQLQAEQKAKLAESDELDYLLSEGGDKEYIEKIAREKLSYVAPDEKVFIDIAGS